jgi:hypothetical protein
MPIIKNYEEAEFITKCITIRKDQQNFLDDDKKKGNRFKLAKFVQFKLDDYIKFKKEADEFLENGRDKTEKTIN